MIVKLKRTIVINGEWFEAGKIIAASRIPPRLFIPKYVSRPDDRELFSIIPRRLHKKNR